MGTTRKPSRSRMRRRRRAIRRFTYAMVALALIVVGALATGWFTRQREENGFDPPAATTTDDGIVRVYLKSLGQPKALGITVDGAYTINDNAGFRLARDSEISVAVDGNDLLLTCGGMTVSMGSRFTMTRCAVPADEDNGLYIHESAQNARFDGNLAMEVENGAIRATLAIPMESYLYGVVAYEMSDSFPIEALKAQAIAARTYAIKAKSNARGRSYDVVDTTADQVYRGYRADYTNVIRAVDATAGIVGMYKSNYANCFYTASNGGQVALPSDIWSGDGDYGYIVRKDDPYDLENPQSIEKSAYISADLRGDPEWTERLTDGVSEWLATLGYSDEVEDYTVDRILSIEPVDPKAESSYMYTGLKFSLSVSGRKWSADTATAEATATPTATVSPEKLALAPIDTPYTVTLKTYDLLKNLLNLSINTGNYETFRVEPAISNGETIGFTVRSARFGHGVGMSQRGAQCMAKNHDFRYDEILSFYYPGMNLVRMDWKTPALSPMEALPQTVYMAAPRPTPKPTPAPLPKLSGDEYYGVVTLASAGSTLNVRAEPSTDAQRIGSLDHRNRVIVTAETSDGWLKIKTVEFTGYVKADYIAKE